MEELFIYNNEEIRRESFEEFENRYKGFGKEFYNNLKENYPIIFKGLELYKVIQKSSFKELSYEVDSYAHFVHEKIIFRIYLDPECEIIGIHNYDFSFEIGCWSENPILELNEFINNEIISLLK